MSFAKNHTCAVLTQDMDFATILAATGDKYPSVILLRGDDTGPESIGPDVVRALRSSMEAINAGALLTITPRGTRTRALPLMKHRSL